MVLIRPQTWQAGCGLYTWKKRLEVDPFADTPLLLARRLWPDASLEFQADDGKAVGLLLASLARSDASMGVDRLAIQAKAQVKRVAARKAAKAARPSRAWMSKQEGFEMVERQHYVWFDRLPEGLRARISQLNRKSAWMHRIIGCIEVTPGVPEAELLWRAICALIEQIEGVADHGFF